MTEMFNGEPQPNQELIKTEFGLQVMRDVSDKIVPPPSNPILTAEGFLIKGVNNPSLIRGLTQLTLVNRDGKTLADTPTPVSQLTQDYLHEHLLNKGETFNDNIAKTTEDAGRIGKTPQELADFLYYFYDVQDYMEEQNKERGSKGLSPLQPQAYEFNERTYLYERRARRSQIEHNILCLNDGSKLEWKQELPNLLYRYSFGGKLTAEEIALTAGFVERPQNDPVMELVKDPQAEAVITSTEQFERINNLRARMNLLENASNYTVVPEDAGTLLRAVDQLPESHLGHLKPTSTEDIIPKAFTVQYENYGFTHKLYDEKLTNELRNALLIHIDTITLPDDGTSRYFEGFVKKTLEMCSEDEPSAQRNYARELFKKVSITEQSTHILYDAATDLIKINNDSTSQLAEVIDEAIPSFHDKFLKIAEEEGWPVDTAMNTADLLTAKNDIDNYIREIAITTDALNRGKQETEMLNRSDIQLLFRVLSTMRKNPDHTMTDSELDTLQALQIDPELLPYALKTKDDTKQSTLGQAVKDLFNDDALKRKEYEDFSRSLPEDLSPDVAEAAEVLAKYGVFHLTPSEFNIHSFQAEVAQVINQAHEREEHVSVRDIGEKYIDVRYPGYGAFLTSDYAEWDFNPHRTENISPITIKIIGDLAYTETVEERNMLGRQKTYYQQDIILGNDRYYVRASESSAPPTRVINPALAKTSKFSEVPPQLVISDRQVKDLTSLKEF